MPRGGRLLAQLADVGARRSDPRALWVFAFEFLTWWHECGDTFYGKRAGDGGVAPSGATFQFDEGLRGVALDAVRVLGGWRVARQLLRLANVEARQDRPRATRAIRIREED